MPIILLAESRDFSRPAADVLRQVGEVRLADMDRAGLLLAVADVEALWVRFRTRIDREILAAAPRLRLVVTATTGTNHIDEGETRRRGIRVLSLKGETDFLKTVRATAELTLALALALLRNLPAAMIHAPGEPWDRERFKGREIYGSTVGVVGYGRLGRIVAGYFQALGATVLAADPHVPPAQLAAGVQLLALPALLARADIVSLHVNLDDATRGFFNAACFQAMKPGASFINTARGELVDETALLAGLESGRVAGAALDVLAGELDAGFVNHPLRAYAARRAHLILTPHIGGCTWESMARAEEFLAQKVADFLLRPTPPSETRS